MNFHDIRFPAALSFGSVGGPQRITDVVQLANGFEERNTPWAHSRRRYDAGLGMRSLDDVETMLAFFEARRGQMYGFRWKDWSDYRSSLASAQITGGDQAIAIGDGSTAAFQLQKTYKSGEFGYARPISKPVAGTVKLMRNTDALSEGVDFTLDYTTGVVTLSTALEEGEGLSGGFEFDVPVRFDTDQIQTSVASFNAGQVPNVPVIEVRV